MKNIFLILFLLINTSSFAQTTSYPAVDKRMEKDLSITSVEITASYTQINFVYTNSSTIGHYIYFTNFGAGAFYLKANGKKYDIISIQNIGNKDGITAAYPNKPVYFSARFAKLPSYTTVFDLREDVTQTWNMYGIHLKTNTSSSTQSTETYDKFRNDYNHVAIYDKEKGTWGDWIKADHTFILNYNSRNDVFHMKANGKNFLYKRMTNVEEKKDSTGEKYQYFEAIDEEGIPFTFYLYSNPKIGIKMAYNNIIIQFSNF